MSENNDDKTMKLTEEEMKAAEDAAEVKDVADAAAAKESADTAKASADSKWNPKNWPMQIVRHVIQVISFFLFPMLFMTIFNGIIRIIMSIASGTFSIAGSASDMIIVGGMLLITALWGRFFCGWLCSIGAVSDLIYYVSDKISPDRPTISAPLDKKLKSLKYVLLAVIVVVALLSAVRIPGLNNTLNNFGGIHIPDLTDLLHLFGGHAGGHIGDAGETFGGTFGQAGTFGTARMITSFVSVLFYLLLFGIIAGSVFVKRFYCRYICPLGAIFTPLSRKRLFKINKNEELCSECGVSCKNCSMGIDLASSENSDSIDSNDSDNTANSDMGDKKVKSANSENNSIGDVKAESVSSSYVKYTSSSYDKSASSSYVKSTSSSYVKSGECINCMECMSSCPAGCFTTNAAPAVAGTCACLAIAGLVAAGSTAPGRHGMNGIDGMHGHGGHGTYGCERDKDFRGGNSNGERPGNGQMDPRSDNNSMPGDNSHGNSNDGIPDNGQTNPRSDNKSNRNDSNSSQNDSNDPDNENPDKNSNNIQNNQFGHRHGHGMFNGQQPDNNSSNDSNKKDSKKASHS